MAFKCNIDVEYVDPAVINHMKQLWVKEKLPNIPHFRHWSMDYARDVYTIVKEAKESGLPQEDLVKLLTVMDVWSFNQEDQQWSLQSGT